VLAAYLRQAPAPSHMPSEPHVATPWSAHTLRGSAPPAGTGVHLPIDDGSAHVRHAPWQARLQQTPSMQNVLAHSEPLAHVWPFCLGPQLPAMQVWPVVQSRSLVHVVSHAPPPQRKGAHGCTPGGRHAPSPLHVPAVSSRSPEHAGATQIVSAL
jgi:hypothetical protein